MVLVARVAGWQAFDAVDPRALCVGDMLD